MLQKARAIHDTDTTTSSSPCSDFHCPKKGACSSTATTARRVLQGHGHGYASILNQLDTQVSMNGYASICETHGAGYVPALCLASESHECAAGLLKSCCCNDIYIKPPLALAPRLQRAYEERHRGHSPLAHPTRNALAKQPQQSPPRHHCRHWAMVLMGMIYIHNL